MQQYARKLGLPVYLGINLIYAYYFNQIVFLWLVWLA